MPESTKAEHIRRFLEVRKKVSPDAFEIMLSEFEKDGDAIAGLSDDEVFDLDGVFTIPADNIPSPESVDNETR